MSRWECVGRAMRPVAVFTLALLGLLSWAPAARAESAGAKRIAVVNVSRVFDAYKKVKDVQQKLEAMFEPQKRELDQLDKELKAKSDIIKSSTEDPQTSRPLFEKIQGAQSAEFELKQKYRTLKENVEKQRMDEMRQVLKEIRAAIRVVGQAEGYDLILRAPEYDEQLNVSGDRPETADNTEPQSSSELVRRFRENPVLYFSQGVDVTQQVITKLNQDYANSGK